MPEIPDDDEPIAYSPTGEAVTRRSLREQAEQARMAGQEFITSMRRMICEELDEDQLATLQRLFRSLGMHKNPANVVSWWEGQIDLAMDLRSDTTDASELTPPDESEVESAAVEPHTIDRHPFQTTLHGGDERLCEFAQKLPGFGENPYVCELPRVAKQHADFES